MHKCRRCGFETKEGNKYFLKDKRLQGGLAYVCRDCANKRYAKLHYDRQLNAHKSKGLARKNAAKRWGSPSQYPCSVLGCERTAEELHHVNYALHLDVVPMCSTHHQKYHSLMDWEKRFEEEGILTEIPNEIAFEPIMTKKIWP